MNSFERRIPLDLSKPCKPWDNSLSNEGYGRLMIDGQYKYVHRLIYQLFVGPIPKGWEIDHACHTAAVEKGECPGGRCEHRSCWEPAHLEAVSSSENSRRGNHPLYVVARRQMCRNGHDFNNPENVYTRQDGRRRCRVCQVEAQRERRRLSKP